MLIFSARLASTNSRTRRSARGGKPPRIREHSCATEGAAGSLVGAGICLGSSFTDIGAGPTGTANAVAISMYRWELTAIDRLIGRAHIGSNDIYPWITASLDSLPMNASAGTPRVILFLAYEGMGLLDITGPQTVFWSASEMMRKRGRPGYVRQTVSLAGGLVRTAEGVALETTPVDKIQTFDTIVVPGSLDIETALEKQDLVGWLRRASDRARRTASVCAGAFFLAEAGLLDGRKAVTHWAMCDTFSGRYPQVEVDRDAIFVRHGDIWTSAGVSAGIDLALALVQDDCGRDVAMEVARQLVIYLKRPGGQSQFSELLSAQTRDADAFEPL